ncbi:MAG: aerobic respiration control sensor protein ArcB, partial [Bacteroidetes bacterium]
IAKPIRANLLIGKVQEHISGNKPEEVEIIAVNEKLQILNTEIIAQLQKYGGPDMVYSALQEFETEANEQLIDCNNALIDKDYKTIQKHLHTLKGTAGTLGIDKVAKTAKSIEAIMKTQDYSSVKEGLKELNDNFAEFKENFTNIISHY